MDKAKVGGQLKKAMEAVARGDFKEGLNISELILMSDCSLFAFDPSH